jgi:hypothetical protein
MKIFKRIINWLFNFGELKLDGSPISSPKLINSETTTFIAGEDLSCYDLVCLSSDTNRVNKCLGILGGKGPDGPIGIRGGKGPDGPIGISGIAKGLKCL